MNVVIIGGGAAGFFAAVRCAEVNPACDVTLLERGPKVLGKVRMSGGGRCNVTHACFEPSTLVTYYPRGGKALLGPFHRFQPRDTVQWFESRGVKLKTEGDGRMFPISDDSATIVDCLTSAARTAGVNVLTHTKIEQICRHEDQFEVALTQNTNPIFADRVLLATGSNAQGYAWAHDMGHTIVSPVPSLFTFNVKDARLEGLAGVSVERVSIALANNACKGAILVTHWGLSGPAVLKLSAWAARELHSCHYTTPIEISWLPHLKKGEVIERLHGHKRQAGAQRVGAHSPFGEIPLRLWKRLVSAAEIFEEQQWAKLPKANLQKLGEQLSRGVFHVNGKGQFKEEFVTCGGVNLDEVNFKTMESRICPGLFFAGEILDIDGVTGGFNFQSAWTTGWLAGAAMATT
jgi:predicted Rossmann fold flavoprotein